MNWNRIKKVITGAGLVSALLLGPGSLFKTTAMADDHARSGGAPQSRDSRRDGDRNVPRGGDRNVPQGDRNWRPDGDRGRNGDQNWRRDGDRGRDWDRGRGGYVYTYPRTYPYGGGGYYGGPYGGYYGGGGYGGGNLGYWEQKGYSDGHNRGREDARSGRYPTPNNSEHFRNGNAAYRQGFARGYQVGFGQYGGGYGRY